MSTNPYAAPKAQVADETVILAGKFVPEGKGVRSGHGWDWIVAGWNLFKRAPGTWIGIILILAVIFIGLGMIPVAGSLASMVLGPIFGAGLMIGCRALDENRDLEIGQLFAGFRERLGTLAAVGGLYLAASVAIGLAVNVVWLLALAYLSTQDEITLVYLGGVSLDLLLLTSAVIAPLLSQRSPEPRLSWAILAGALRFGVGWIRTGDGFAVVELAPGTDVDDVAAKTGAPLTDARIATRV